MLLDLHPLCLLARRQEVGRNGPERGVDFSRRLQIAIVPQHLQVPRVVFKVSLATRRGQGVDRERVASKHGCRRASHLQFLRIDDLGFELKLARFADCILRHGLDDVLAAIAQALR